MFYSRYPALAIAGLTGAMVFLLCWKRGAFVLMTRPMMPDTMWPSTGRMPETLEINLGTLERKHEMPAGMSLRL
ncbi:hypothetical protein BVRB_031380 [Beta vulgaris subsp. vulgaris]|uniref:Uncharacterized protein n=1 Tax=Beta vulgaris subsp. vulgaris TaxID=3555 RepID=A0A0J8B0J9_BETVV|nr:hypothetical protein BVRB_031380 [Beta vulgaris subsp. vulgaris]